MSTESILFAYTVLWVLTLGIVSHLHDRKRTEMRNFIATAKAHILHRLEQLVMLLKEKGYDKKYYPPVIPEDYKDYFLEEGGMTDVEADADTFKSIGWGTDEDYGYYGEDESW